MDEVILIGAGLVSAVNLGIGYAVRHFLTHSASDQDVKHICDGFSFLHPELPRFQSLIVILGDTVRTYVNAKVVNVVHFNERGVKEYQVQCRFAGRIAAHLFKH